MGDVPRDAGEAEADKPPVCPVCGGSAWSIRLEGVTDRQFDLPGEYRVWECETCGTWRIWPVPGDLAAHYPEGYGPHIAAGRRYVARPWHRAWPMSFSPVPPARSAARWLLQYNFAAQDMWRYLDRPPRSVFDFGCGSGRFVGSASQLGIRAVGMDISENAVSAARACGLECTVGTHDDLSGVDGPFDLVRVWHVLEHLPDPVAALVHLRTLLRPGGKLLVAAPNADSALAKLFGRDWMQLDAPRHLWDFTSRSLAMALEAAGFEVERVIYEDGGLSTYESLRYALASRDASASLPGEPVAEVVEGLRPLARQWSQQGQSDAVIVLASYSDRDGA